MHDEDTPTPRKRWQMAGAPDPADVDFLVEETGMPRPICYLLVQRGITDIPEARSFLKPRLEELRDPFEMKGMRALVDRLLEAGEKGETVGIHGDYDVDGLTSTAFLTRLLEKLDVEVVPFVPNRMRDGYGIAEHALTVFDEAGVDVLLTCDTGISAHETLGRAREEYGFDVLVLDHHLPDETLPDATAIVNPGQPGCEYPFTGMCAAGLAYKLGEALCAELELDPKTYLYPHMDLVALGTVCDVVPLVDENRVLATYGLRVARRTRNIGLRALLEQVKLDASELDERKFGWVLGPRLNAVGRIDDAAKGLELLLAEDGATAAERARMVDELNHERRALTDDIERDVMQRLESVDLDDVYGLALFDEKGEGPDWHHGLLGIIAGRVTRRTGRPTFLFARHEETGVWKGSGRAVSAVESVHLRDALAACREHLQSFGGHRAAAGATLAAGADPGGFVAAFNDALAEQMAAEDRLPVVTAHLEVGLDEITRDMYDLLELFAPFGEANEEVTMMARNVRVVGARRIGKSRTHVKLQVEQNGLRFEALGWGMADELPHLVDTPTPYEADLVFKVHENTFRGTTSLQLVFDDLRVGRVLDNPSRNADRGRQRARTR